LIPKFQPGPRLKRVLEVGLANTYMDLLGDDALLLVTRKALDFRRASLRLTQLKFDNQAASQLERSRSQSVLAGAKVALTPLTRQRAQDENALVLLLGQALPADFAAGLAEGSNLGQQALITDLPADCALRAFSASAQRVASRAAANRQQRQYRPGLRSVLAAHHALAGRATLTEQLRAQSAQLQAEATRTTLTELGFEHGAANSLELLDAQRCLLAAQQAVVQQLKNLVAL